MPPPARWLISTVLGCRNVKGKCMNFTVLSAYLVAIVVLIGTPGPIVALVMNAASRHGFNFALITVLGSNAASLVLLATAALIVSGMLALDERSLQWISLIGCGFIGWLAVTGLRTELTQSNEVKLGQPESVKQHSGFFNGFFLGISNPKDIIFFVAFFPQFIHVTANQKLSLGVLALLWMVADFIILLSYAWLMRGGFFQYHKKGISLLSSAFLLLIAVSGIAYTLHNWQ